MLGGDVMVVFCNGCVIVFWSEIDWICNDGIFVFFNGCVFVFCGGMLLVGKKFWWFEMSVVFCNGVKCWNCVWYVEICFVGVLSVSVGVFSGMFEVCFGV